eukprot:scaffold106600_cov27-Phaeocystis_antarctica.AAC.2
MDIYGELSRGGTPSNQPCTSSAITEGASGRNISRRFTSLTRACMSRRRGSARMQRLPSARAPTSARPLNQQITSPRAKASTAAATAAPPAAAPPAATPSSPCASAGDEEGVTFALSSLGSTSSHQGDISSMVDCTSSSE